MRLISSLSIIFVGCFVGQEVCTAVFELVQGFADHRVSCVDYLEVTVHSDDVAGYQRFNPD